MHRFTDPTHCGDDTLCLEQIPKRIRGRPQYGAAPDHFTAWGLYFQETVDMERLCACCIIAFLVSLLSGVLWATYKKSLQDGFAVASYILTFETMTIGTIQVGIALNWL